MKEINVKVSLSLRGIWLRYRVPICFEDELKYAMEGGAKFSIIVISVSEMAKPSKRGILIGDVLWVSKLILKARLH
jgi:hypothetical protein